MRPSQDGGSARAAATSRIGFAEVRPILEGLPDSLSAALKSAAGGELESAWQRWVARHEREVQERLERGDEDTVVNFWLFGTSFTTAAPARAQDLARLDTPAARVELFERRLEDLTNAVIRGDPNERVAFVRQYLQRKGVDPAAASGRSRLRRLLVLARSRTIAEFAATDRRLETARQSNDPAAEIAAQSTIFRERGLSSDTSVPVNFVIDRALAELAAGGLLAPGSLRRIGVIGPGLDVINKADGHDFYPQQTIQPFALIDSLRRLGLAGEAGLAMATLDISARVNHHLESAGARAEAGQPYLLHLPLGRNEGWTPDLLAYWKNLGARIGTEVTPRAAPAGDVDVRALEVAPAVVRMVTPYELDIVLDRLELDPADRFDLIVATNVLVYYDVFEQALAAVNLAHMLRPGGILLSNNDFLPVPPFDPAVGVLRVPYSDRHHDNVFTFWRRGR